MSKYGDSLSSILRNCESSLGIFKSVKGQKLETVPILEFFNIYKHLEFSREQLLEAMKTCGYNMASLTYLDFRCTYRKVSVLDFGLHGRVDLLANLLLPYVRRTGVTVLVKNNITYIVSYLELLESKNKDFIKTLSYRYIRLFLVYVLRGDLTHAGMTANFILNQIFISENIDNAIRDKIDDLMNAGKEVEKIKNEYFEGRDIKHMYRKTAQTVEDAVDKSKDSLGKFKSIRKNKVSFDDDKEGDDCKDIARAVNKNKSDDEIKVSHGFKSAREED